MEEFEENIPPTTRFSVGYFESRQSGKKWLITQEDLAAMYSLMSATGKTDVCLWCDGCDGHDDNNSRKRKKDRESSPAPPSKRAAKEREVDDLAEELKIFEYSDPQYRLWARMIINGTHSSKDTPPQVPMITGITPSRPARKTMEETVASTVSAVVKAMATPQTPRDNPLQYQVSEMGLSPSKAVDIRGKCFAQLSSLKKLFEEAVITEEELKEQKGCILNTLRKFS